MAITAKFLADFDAFVASTKNAENSLKNLEASGASAGATFEKMKSVATTLAGAFGVAFSIGAVVNFGREVLQAGDTIQKMADQTGLGVESVQRLQYIAGQSGTSIESLVGAVQNLQQRLGDDNSGAAGAMAKLGINLSAFSRLDTYAQMTSLAEAIRAIHDPTEQASLAAALFGKTWKEILPAIKAGMEDVGKQAPVMSAETVKALDEAGDALTRMKQRAIVWGGDVVMALEKASKAASDFAYWAAGSHPPMAAFNVDSAMMTIGVDRLSDSVQKSATQIAAGTAKLKEHEAALKKAGEEAAAWGDVEHAMSKLVQTNLDEENKRFAENTAGAKRMHDAVVASEEAALVATKKQNDELQRTKELADAAAKALRDMGGSQTYDLSTKEGMDYFKKSNPAARISGAALSPDFFKTHNLQQAIEMGLIDLYGGYRAAGGPVKSGAPYMVGEQGPELFVPSSAGSILPNLPSGGGRGAGGGSTVIQVNVNVSGVFDPATARQLGDVVGKELLARSGIKYRAA